MQQINERRIFEKNLTTNKSLIMLKERIKVVHVYVQMDIYTDAYTYVWVYMSTNTTYSYYVVKKQRIPMTTKFKPFIVLLKHINVIYFYCFTLYSLNLDIEIKNVSSYVCI